MTPLDAADPLTLGVALVALLGAGVVAGLLAGLLGVGGGLVIVPVLYYLGGALGIDEAVRMHLAVGTSLATIVVTSAMSARTHFRHGAVDRAAFVGLAPGVVLGVVAGTLIAGGVKGPTLTAGFALFALFAAMRMATMKHPDAISDRLPGGPTRPLVGMVIGSVSTLVGIGGGTLSVPILVAFGRPIHRAVGTSAALGAVIAIPGSLGFVLVGWDAQGLPPGSLGYVNLVAGAAIVAMTTVFAPIGARLAHRTDPTRLKMVFAVLLAVVAARMLYGAFFA